MMNKYFGIDLGTTNSVIASYDGLRTRVWKSPDQNDVTPSVIYFDPRGNRYVGKRASDAAILRPENSAALFKRLMGTNTMVSVSGQIKKITPEECSANVLKTLYGYLSEDLRSDPCAGTVVTVPAAFNQMQKQATFKSAKLAGIGNIAIVQEPVAAAMSVIHNENLDGRFLIYDLGGGTLDLSIVENIAGRINLVSLGGIAMCGGVDFDRAILSKIVSPWLYENYNLPLDFFSDFKYKSLALLANWASEQAKIELSSRNESIISLSEAEIRLKDQSGKEIYLDVELRRETYNNLISNYISESLSAIRELFSDSAMMPSDIDFIVFVGGPTSYKPLRDMIAFDLGIKTFDAINPMTAVAEGASLFAESIDWGAKAHTRKAQVEKILSKTDLNVSFNYTARTTKTKAKIICFMNEESPQALEIEINALDNSWTSGKIRLHNETKVEVNLPNMGENIFKLLVTDSKNSAIILDKDIITIMRTKTTVVAIPASHSIGIEVLDKVGGSPNIDYLVKTGEPLPKKGKRLYKASETLKAGSLGSINIKIWEGDIEFPIADNRLVGVLKIAGSDFIEGIIPAGADLECSYEVLDSGNIFIEVSVPCIGATFQSHKNFYSPQEGHIDYANANSIIADGAEKTISRIDEINSVLSIPQLDETKEMLQDIISIAHEKMDMETAQHSMEKVLRARKIISKIRDDHLSDIRKIDLNLVTEKYNELRGLTRPSESSAFDTLVNTAKRSIDAADRDFEYCLDELNYRVFQIKWRQDPYVVATFEKILSSSEYYTDQYHFQNLVKQGKDFIANEDIDSLRKIVIELSKLGINNKPDDEIRYITNILRA